MGRPKGSKSKKPMKREEIATSLAEAKEQLEQLNANVHEVEQDIASKTALLKDLKNEVKAAEKRVIKLDKSLQRITEAEEIAGKKREIDLTISELMKKGVSPGEILDAISKIS